VGVQPLGGAATPPLAILVIGLWAALGFVVSRFWSRLCMASSPVSGPSADINRSRRRLEMLAALAQLVSHGAARLVPACCADRCDQPAIFLPLVVRILHFPAADCC